MHSIPDVPAGTATLTRGASTYKAAVAPFHNTQRSKSTRPEALSDKAECLICVIDPDYSVRKATSRFFAQRKYRVEIFASLPSFLSSKAHDGPCCLLVDTSLPGLCGFTLPHFFSRTRRAEQIIIMSEEADVRMCVRSLRAGAIDFLTKPLKDVELSEAVNTALQRSRELLRLQEQRRSAEALLNRLTPREREVLGFVIAGRINKEIGAELGASEKTIKKHRGQVMQKLRVASVAELARFSILHGVKPTPPMGPRSPIQA